MPLSRTSVSVAARTGAQLFRYLLQPARRAYATNFFAARSYETLRSSRLDDVAGAGVVCGGVSAGDFAYSVDHSRPGETSASLGWTILPGGMSGTGRKKALTTGSF